MLIGDRIKVLREEKSISQVSLAEVANTTKQTIYKYENNIIKSIPSDKVELIAKALSTSPAYLMGWTGNPSSNGQECGFQNAETRCLPIIGEIACGKPIFCNQEYPNHVVADAKIKADFALRVHGDSMINARIEDGDIVFIKEQPTVENGQIAAVIIDDTATLKRVYIKDEIMTLVAENSDYAPIVVNLKECTNVTILGRAMVFQSDIE